jgi:hypothetical protein
MMSKLFLPIPSLPPPAALLNACQLSGDKNKLTWPAKPDDHICALTCEVDEVPTKDTPATDLCARTCQPCVSDNNPVCGSNKITYPSMCDLNKAIAQDQSLSLGAYGACPICPRPCPAVSGTADRVCGTDGVTYDSHCALMDKKLCGTCSTVGGTVVCTGKVPWIQVCSMCRPLHA